jgi:hypothetical protein
MLSAVFAATTVPIQLLNPIGSTSGQAIVSTGPSTAPAWTGVALLTGVTFSGNVTISATNSAVIVNDTSGTGSPQFAIRSNGTTEWVLFDAASIHAFTINRYVSGTFADAPLTISNSTGAVTMTDGITNSPISGSTGSFTTLRATSTITPSSTAGIVGTTTNDNAQAGSVGEILSNTTSSTSLTTTVVANCTSVSLTPGDWDVEATVQFIPGGTATTSLMLAGISTTSATVGGLGTYNSSVIPFGSSASVATLMSSPVVRVTLTTTTTVYAIAQTTFSASTMTCNAFIRARRVR